MANQVYGFFDSAVNDPRDYSEIDMSRALHMIGGEGVTGMGDNLRVASAQDGLHVRVQYGRAMCQGYYYELRDDGGAPMTLAHEAAPSLPRVDRVVLRLDRGIAARTVTLAVRQGTPAASPVPPALQRSDTVYELSLARVRVATGAGLLNESDITDERDDETLCGILAPGRVEDLFSKLSAAAITTATPGESVQQALDSKLPKANLANDLTTANAGYALDARQGPVLVQAIGDAAGAVSGRVDSLETNKMVNVYTHTRTGSVHNFNGTGPNGRALITAAFQPGDTFAVNGVAKPAYMGADLMDELPVGRWVSFTYDGSQLNFKGGGAGLAVRVVGGTTQPSNPRDNTIWVNTATPIPAYTIATSVLGLWPPELGPSYQGVVIVLLATSSAVPYLTFSKAPRAIIGYVGKVQQYINNAWTFPTAKIFKNNAWHNLTNYLYDNGTQTVPWVHSAQQPPLGGTGTIDVSTSGTLFLHAVFTGGQRYAGALVTLNPVDTTNYGNLYVNVTDRGGPTEVSGAAGVWLLVTTSHSTAGDWGPQNTVASLRINGTGTQSINLASINGNYYIALLVISSGANNNNSMVRASQVWLA